MKIFQHIGNYNQLCVNNLNADSVNTYFVNVGKYPSSVLPTHVEPKSKNLGSSSLFFRNTSPLEIARCINCLKKSEPEDFMGMSSKFLKMANSEISRILPFLIDRAISEIKFPKISSYIFVPCNQQIL